jgi:hypothetical protein
MEADEVPPFSTFERFGADQPIRGALATVPLVALIFCQLLGFKAIQTRIEPDLSDSREDPKKQALWQTD